MDNNDNLQPDMQINYKTNYSAVRKARRFALQGLYEWMMTDKRFLDNPSILKDATTSSSNSPTNIAIRTRAQNAMHTVHLAYYHELMRQIPEEFGTLREQIKTHLDRDFERLDMIERASLLIGCYELLHSLHIPYKVVIDEAMQLNAHFGATDGHKLINAVMDKLAKQLRFDEVQHDKKNNQQTKNKS